MVSILYHNGILTHKMNSIIHVDEKSQIVIVPRRKNIPTTKISGIDIMHCGVFGVSLSALPLRFILCLEGKKLCISISSSIECPLKCFPLS